MPRRCGCSSASCNCVVEAGDGIEVTGAGSVNNPYVVSLDNDFSLSGRLQVQDSSTIDFTLSGDGSLNNPYVLTGDTSLALGDLTNVDTSNNTVGNVLARQPDGTFALNPPSTAAPGTIMSDNSIDGDGSAGDPLTVHDYDRIAWLSGADNLPNNGQLRMGNTVNAADSAFWVARQHTGGSGALAYNVQADHKISSIVGTDLTPKDNPAGGPYAAAGLQLRVQDNNQQPDRWSDLRVFQDGRIARYNRWLNGQVITEQASYIPYAMWATRIIIQGTGDAYADYNLTFPAGVFTAGPQLGDDGTSFLTVTANRNTLRNATGSEIPYLVTIYELTNTGCVVRYHRLDGGTFSGTHGVGVQVVQMSPP